MCVNNLIGYYISRLNSLWFNYYHEVVYFPFELSQCVEQICDTFFRVHRALARTLMVQIVPLV